MRSVHGTASGLEHARLADSWPLRGLVLVGVAVEAAQVCVEMYILVKLDVVDETVAVLLLDERDLPVADPLVPNQFVLCLVWGAKRNCLAATSYDRR